MESIIEQTGLIRPVVNKLRQRFREKGIGGIKDAPRSCKPRTTAAEQHAIVIDKACSKQEDGYTNWSHKRIAEQVGISQSKDFQILSQVDLKPHKIEYWSGKTNGTEFEEKMINIVGLYMAPSEIVLVICLDKRTQIQALDTTQPELTLRTDNPRRQTATCKSDGTVSLIAALVVPTGEVTSKIIKSNNAENFLSFLKTLDRRYNYKNFR